MPIRSGMPSLRRACASLAFFVRAVLLASATGLPERRDARRTASATPVAYQYSSRGSLKEMASEVAVVAGLRAQVVEQPQRDLAERVVELRQR